MRVCVCVCIFVCPVAFHLFFFSLTYNPRTCLFFCVPLFGSIENGKDVHKNTIASFENIFVFFFCQTKNSPDNITRQKWRMQGVIEFERTRRKE